jgi:hypothetical protein
MKSHARRLLSIDLPAAFGVRSRHHQMIPTGLALHRAARDIARLLAPSVSIALLVLLATRPAAAQDSRREALEAQRAARASTLGPYEPGKIEKALMYVEEHRLIERFSTGDGWYPVVGSIQRSGGFAFGAGYRKHFASRHLLFNVRGGMTVKGYRLASGEISAPYLFGERLAVTGRVKYLYLPQEDYYGIGADSLKDDRTNFLLEETEVGGIVRFYPRRWLTISGKVAALNPRLGSGTDSLYPSTEELFSESTAPGLNRQPNFLESGMLVEFDTRDQPGNPRSGTYVSLLTVRYGDRDDLGYEFRRGAAEVQQYFPIFDKKRVIALRAAVNQYDPASDSSVPFYYMTPLGGKDSIRGFNDFRFRDLHAALFNVEYRWEAFSGLDMALFYDTGEVGRRWKDLTLGELRHSWGLGFRFNTYRAVFLRTEIAFNSGEGTRFYVAFSGPLRLERYLR